jgi:hypothetical protein
LPYKKPIIIYHKQHQIFQIEQQTKPRNYSTNNNYYEQKNWNQNMQEAPQNLTKKTTQDSSRSPCIFLPIFNRQEITKKKQALNHPKYMQEKSQDYYKFLTRFFNKN